MPGSSDRIVRVDPVHPDPAAIGAAADCIRGGGVVVVPTRGLYGLGADALRPETVDRVFAVKGRPENKPVLVLISERATVDRLVAEASPLARRLMDRFWPGRLTLVMPARPGLPEGLAAGTGTVGVRLCGHPVARALVAAVGGPVTGTSANPSGGPGCDRIDRLDPSVDRRADHILDAGPLAGGPGSTVVDVSGERPTVLRYGAVGPAELAAVFAEAGADFSEPASGRK